MRLGLLAVLAALGCLAGEPINQPPVVDSVDSTSIPSRWDRPVILEIVVSDPDHNGTSVRWTVTFPDPDAQTVFGQGSTVQFQPIGPGTYRLSVTVVDDLGAEAHFDQTVEVQDMAPQVGALFIDPPASVTSATYRAGTFFHVGLRPTSLVDDDPFESQTLRWRLAVRPATSQAEWTPCSNEPKDACFRADTAGKYVIELSVQDPHGKSGTQRAEIIVDPDHPPCITGTLPSAATSVLFVDVGQTVSLRVTSVSDDLDPFPAGADGTARFDWALRLEPEGPFMPIAGYPYPELIVPTSRAPGTRLGVRVIVHDRVERALSCPADSRECDYAPMCLAWQTWEIEYR